MNFNKLIKTISNGAKKHSPEILVAFGIAGGVGSTILAVKATPKALMLIEEEKRERRKNDEDDILKPLEVVKVAWKPYIPAVVSGAAGIACIMTSYKISTGRTAAIATAYKLTETAFSEYKEAVVEELGKEKEHIIKEKVDAKKVEKHPTDNKEVVIMGSGDYLCFDSISSRYFRSDKEKIRKAVNDLNAELISQDYISLNEFYYNLGLDGTSIGDNLGWNIAYGTVEIEYTTQMAKNGEPCLVLNYDVAPRYDFSKMM